MAWDIPVGTVTTRAAVAERFGGATQGGIQPSAKSPNVFVYSDPASGAKHGYNFDGWSTDGAYYYTGEGQLGDQRLRRGNGQLAAHGDSGRTVRVFEAVPGRPGGGGKPQRYVGAFRVDPERPYRREEAPDREQVQRSVLVFRLLPIGETWSEAMTVGTPAQSASAVIVEVESNQVQTFEQGAREGTVAERREAALMTELETALLAVGHEVGRVKVLVPGSVRPLLTDTFDVTRGELFEVKAAATRANVRMAIGQLLDYRRHIEGVTSTTVALPEKPGEDLIALIHECGFGLVASDGEGLARIAKDGSSTPL